jgi:IPT/TIG domain
MFSTMARETTPSNAGGKIRGHAIAAVALLVSLATAGPASAHPLGAGPFSEGIEAPAVVTEPASAVTMSSATLNGSVDPNGREVTSCHFEYGKTPAYGSTAPCSGFVGTGTSPVAVTASIARLSPATTYNFKLVATSAGGTAEGENVTFVTVAPSIKRLTPKSGPAAGGTVVTISGAGFSGATEVTFGSTPASEFEVIGATTINAVSPASTGSGTIDVRVSVGATTSPLTPKDRFGFKDSITGLSPTSGPESGGTEVTITGAGFTPGSEGLSVLFGGVAATSVECLSTSECIAVTPAHRHGKAKVTAMDEGQKLKSPVKFEYKP